MTKNRFRLTNTRRADVVSPDWPIYLAEAPVDAQVQLSQEHDRYEWLPLEQAAARVLPERVRASLIAAARELAVAARKASAEP